MSIITRFKYHLAVTHSKITMMPASAITLSEYGSNRVYNRYLARQMNLPTTKLKRIAQEWDEKSLVGRVLSSLNPFDDIEVRAFVAKDLIAAQEHPYGKSAGRIKLMLRHAV